MRIGYFTLDEVNENLAQQLAVRFRVQLERLSFCDGSADQCCDARLYEVDYLAPGDRQRLFDRLTVSSSSVPVAVHGFHVCKREARYLRAAGISVFRRLQTKVFRRLIDAGRELGGSRVHLLTGSDWLNDGGTPRALAGRAGHGKRRIAGNEPKPTHEI
jgi:hypothetical protein